MTNKLKHFNLWMKISENLQNTVTKPDHETNPKKLAYEQLGYTDNLQNFSYCYACLECERKCKNCPIKWSDEESNASCVKLDSAFSKFAYHYNNNLFIQAAFYAEMIARMEWK